MSTRGLWGFRKNGCDKLTYNHFDSYPSGLGKDIVDFCCSTSIDELNRICDSIYLVNGDSQPTDAQMQECIEAGYFDPSVDRGTPLEWYCLIRKLQGNFQAYKQNALESKRTPMIDDKNFIRDSLMCEYAYIINLDTNMLEYYQGFQRTPDPENRYGTDKDKYSEYYPCALVDEFPLGDGDNADDIVNLMIEEDEERG